MFYYEDQYFFCISLEHTLRWSWSHRYGPISHEVKPTVILGRSHKPIITYRVKTENDLFFAEMKF